MSDEISFPRIWVVDTNGNIMTFGGSGGGDASATNQEDQITLETAIRDRLPSALIGDRLKVDIISGGFISTATIQRAANTTPYTANDVYGAAFELPNIVGVANGNIILTSIDIIFNISAVPTGMSAFTLYLYSVTPPSVITDNGAFSLPLGDRASILTPTGISLGSVVLATGGGSVVLEIDNLNLQYQPVSTSLFGYLVTSGAFTPAANNETATIRARVLVA
jgi:hypothetical protein